MASFRKQLERYYWMVQLLYNRDKWYKITHDDGSGQRFIDYTRASCLPWVRAIIDNAEEPEVSVFHAIQASRKHGIADNLYLWLEELNFVVILREVKRGRMDGQMLITAYDTGEYTSLKLAKLRDKYIRQ